MESIARCHCRSIATIEIRRRDPGIVPAGPAELRKG